MNNPLVYVLVINWNGLEHLEECFDSLLQSTYPNAKYILVDNASDDGSVEFVQHRYDNDACVDILECGSNLGWSGGNNKGMEYALDAGADYILLLNNDTRTDPGAIEALVQHAEADTTIGALSPKILLYDNPHLLNSVGLEATVIGSSWDKGIGRIDAPQWDTVQPIIGVCGAAMFIRSSVLKKTGLLPTDFDIYLDDLDLSLRIWMAGFTIHTCPGSRVWHKFSATMGEGKRAQHKYYLNTRNRARIIMRNYPIIKFPLIKLLYIIGEAKAIGRAMLQGEGWRVAAHIKSWFAAWAYIPAALSARKKLPGSPWKIWPMILRTPLFFPGTEFPDQGIYSAESLENKECCPISTHAVYQHDGGPIQIELVANREGMFEPEIALHINGRQSCILTSSNPKYESDIPSGDIMLTSPKFVAAEDSGRHYDIAGWVRITPGTE